MRRNGEDELEMAEIREKEISASENLSLLSLSLLETVMPPPDESS
ncbi:uncharacterized protein G2W53_035654 [Senna tora]|uniref:Uncharacterized protein n=1 Tax=Senna tora TaxID=362788 RepID=A0A834W7S7_9FABA|nr:uncharacterized protein G2W53_035654 [Senna tora]